MTDAAESVWHDPQIWDGLTTWTTLALYPLLVFLACVLQPDVDVQRELRDQWFYSTSPGPHRILAEWHTLWIALACLLGGVSQFLAWRADSQDWEYPAAMAVFYVAVAFHCAWIAAYFRLVSKFRAGRALIVVTLLVDALLASLYAPLDKAASVLVFVRVLIHDGPMLYIANAAVRVHADPDAARPHSPRARRAEQGRATSPTPSPRPSRGSRMGFDDIAGLIADDHEP